jgi:adenylyltransferase/sulfurtransferase
MPEIDIAGQQQLLDSTVMLIGLGGLGSPVAIYLAASGVGHLILNDHDQVDLGNLQRQILHTTSDIERAKVDSARDRLHALNPGIHISSIAHRLTADDLMQKTKDVDVVIDASDNFTTRYALNSACVNSGVPLVWGAATGFDGQVTTFINNNDESPCLNCLYPQSGRDIEETCATTGIFAPLTGVIGSMMAVEAVKILLGVGKTLCGRLLRINALTLEWRQSLLNRDPICSICAKH